MKPHLKDIYLAFDGKLVGSSQLKHEVCRAVSLLPADIINRVTKSSWFIGSTADSWAYAFDGKELKNQHLIYLSDDLFRQPQEQITFTIIHEIGHVILDHKNSITRIQTKEEIKKQESQADDFAQMHIAG